MNPDSTQQVVESNSARKRRLAREFNEARANQPVSRSIGDLTRAEREELNALSKDVFGASSRWQKLVTDGVSELVTEEVTELVPGEKEGDEATTRQVQVPVKFGNNGNISRVKHYTVDSIREFMTARKKQLDEIRAAIKKQQEEARAKQEQEQLTKKVHEDLQGSAI